MKLLPSNIRHFLQGSLCKKISPREVSFISRVLTSYTHRYGIICVWDKLVGTPSEQKFEGNPKLYLIKYNEMNYMHSNCWAYSSTDVYFLPKSLEKLLTTRIKMPNIVVLWFGMIFATKAAFNIPRNKLFAEGHNYSYRHVTEQGAECAYSRAEDQPADRDRGVLVA